MPSDISQLAECNRAIRTMKLRRRSIKIRTPHGGESGDTHVSSTEKFKKMRIFHTNESEYFITTYFSFFYYVTAN